MCIRVPDLNVTGRRMSGKALGRGCYPVDAVFAHAASAHDDQVAWRCCLFFARDAVDCRGHETHGRHKDEAFAEIPLVKEDLPVRRRNTAFVAAVAHPFNDAVQ